MLLNQERIKLGLDGLDAAWERLLDRWSDDVLDYHNTGLTDSAESAHQFWRELATSDTWRMVVHCDGPTNGLLLAESLRAASPDADQTNFPDGLEREGSGWVVPRRSPLIWFGDAHVPGDLGVDAPLIVLGSLTVDGLLRDGDVFHSYVIVAGDVRVRALRSGADHFVLGSLSASVISCFNNDGSLVVGGELSADLLLSEEHDVAVFGETRARVADCDSNPPEEDLARWLPADYVDFGAENRDDRLDRHRILREAAAGHSPVLAEPRPVEFPLPAELVEAIAAPAGVTMLELHYARLHRIPAEIATLTELTKLVVDNTPLPSLAGIECLPSLRRLSMRSTPVLSLLPLLALAQLEYLDVSYCRKISDWQVLAQLPALRMLVAHRCPVPAELYERGLEIDSS